MSRQSTELTTLTTAVSWTDLQSLRRKLRDGKFVWTALTNAERWRYHAYDYAFLRMRHGLDNRSYPLDPEGKWFHAALVDAAEAIYRPRPAPRNKLRPADVAHSPELAARFRHQDAERDALRRQVQIHGERSSNGEPTPEMLAYMRCCAEQVEANAKTYAERNRRAFGPEGRMSQAQLNAALGVTATEQKPRYEDAEELRRGRIALGLEDPAEE